MAGEAHIRVTHVDKSFGDPSRPLPVLKDISLSIAQGEFVTFFGPNGSGKTTLLNVLAGVESVDRGEVRLMQQAGPSTIGYVFQDYRGNLMPWLTVAENIAFPLKIRGVPSGERARRVEELLDRYNFELDLSAHTYTLSGGQAQLTSILRALAIRPSLLLMDEPFSALDYHTNLDLYEKLHRIWNTDGATILLVSHDLDEALYLGERTVFLTHRPATILAVVPSPLPRTKSLEDLGTAEFAAVKREALGLLRRGKHG